MSENQPLYWDLFLAERSGANSGVPADLLAEYHNWLSRNHHLAKMVPVPPRMFFEGPELEVVKTDNPDVFIYRFTFHVRLIK
jgi:hypothetical protein